MCQFTSLLTEHFDFITWSDWTNPYTFDSEMLSTQVINFSLVISSQLLTANMSMFLVVTMGLKRNIMEKCLV